MDPFVAEIRILTCNFAPHGWAFCDGQILPLSQNTALFSLLGANYGGDGKSTFGLPDLQGRAPLHAGQGPGLSLRDLGEEGGSETVALLESEIPNHAHTISADAGGAGNQNPQGQSWGSAGRGRPPIYAPYVPAQSVVMSSDALSVAGASTPHNNMPPYLTLNFCIALQGVYPPRT